MSAATNSCNSCFVKYDNKTRQAKILQCYHTYCKQCLEQYMFSNGVVTCLSCGNETVIKSVELIPNNPYMGQGGGKGHHGKGEDSGNGEELYYSDSDEDDTSADSPGPAQSSSNNSINNSSIDPNHIEGIKSMVLNTQRANVGKIQQLNQQILSKIHQLKMARSQKESRLDESLQAVDDFKQILLQERNGILNTGNEINKYENQLTKLQMELAGINLLDFKTVKSIYEECLLLNSGLNDTMKRNERLLLEESVRQSTIKINFDAADGYIKHLGADNDTIFMKLCTLLEKDPSMVYLTTYMLSTIFTEKIATHNVEFKALIEKKLVDMSRSLPGPLDDPTGYIEYIKSFQDIKDKDRDVESNGFRSSEAKSVNESDCSRSNSPDASENWKVVGTIANKKEMKETKKQGGMPLSFSEMAKKPGNPETRIVKKVVGVPQRPRCYFKLQVDNEDPFRVVFEMRPDMAPKMVDNFIKLCEGLPNGVGYKGSKIFRAKANDHILGGDFEFNNGSGGFSAFEEKYFMAEQCPLKDKKGAIRMKGLERTPDGRCKIGSQFMIWVGDLEYKEYKFTLVFGEVVEGFDKLQEVSRIKAVQKSNASWILRQTVTVVDSGVL